MNRYKLSKAGVNTNEAIARFGGNKEAYEKALKGFSEEPYFSRLRQAVKERKLEDAFQAAHALKGQVGNLGMTRFFEDLCPLVTELRLESFEKADELMVLLEEDYLAVISALS